MASNTWMLRAQIGGWRLPMLRLAAWQLIQTLMVRSCVVMMVGAAPGLGGFSEAVFEAIS